MKLGPENTALYTRLAVHEGDWRSLGRAFPGCEPTTAMRQAFERARPRYLDALARREAGLDADRGIVIISGFGLVLYMLGDLMFDTLEAARDVRDLADRRVA